MKPATWEMIKEGFRLLFFAVIAYVITFLTQYFNALPQNDQTIAGIAFVLRLIDKWLAEKNTSILPGLQNARGISII